MAGLAVERDARLVSWAPGVLWYAVSSACSSASTRMSKQISFSRSSARRMLRSMSIGVLALVALAVELDLDEGRGDVGVGHLAVGAVDVERRRGLVAGGDAAGQRLALDEGDLHQAAVVAAPVARQGERPVDAARGHLEGVGLLAHHVGRVEHLGDRARRVGDVVEGHPAVLVDGDPQHASLAGRCHLHRLEVEAPVGQGSGEGLLDPVPGGVLLGAAHECATSLCCCPSGPR